MQFSVKYLNIVKSVFQSLTKVQTRRRKLKERVLRGCYDACCVDFDIMVNIVERVFCTCQQRWLMKICAEGITEGSTIFGQI